MSSPGGKIWFSAAELAEAGLPGLSSSKRKINQLAEAERWALRTDAAGAPLARPRMARGGGLEFHISLLPPAAGLALQKRSAPVSGVCAAHASPATSAGQLWTWYDRQSDKTKAEAQRRVAALQAVLSLERAGATRTTAVNAVSGERGIGAATLWSWLQLIAGADASDWLPHVAPRRAGGGCEAEIDADIWQVFVSNYLRPERPTMATSYRLAKQVAAASGTGVACLKTFQRKLEREIDGRVIILRREGEEALRRSMPAQKRSVAELSAMELVNIDGHKWDVFVRFPGEDMPRRPMMVAIQDIYSRKFLAWRIGQSESAELTRLCLADLFAKWGIPGGMLLDNGRAFASKQITGGSDTRYRFKKRAEDPAGVLTSLGVQIHWALPFRGQSKPIERGFRDFCSEIAKHPAFAGAWTGNTIDAKPENYGSSAVDLETFERVVAEGIAAHNARDGRRTETARGRSFDTAFAESYARSTVRKATPEQVRIALTAADRVTVNRQTGHIELFGNRYWSESLGALAGQRVTVRFDPAALHEAIHVYDSAERFVATVPAIATSGFLDVAAAKARARLESDHKKAVRRAADAANLLSAAELAAMLPAYEDEDLAPEPAAIRPVRARHSNAALKLAPIADTRPAVEDRFMRAVGKLRLVD